MTAQKGLQFLKQVVDTSVKAKCFESVLSNVKVISGGDGQCRCEMTITENDQNRGGTLHGGLTATLVDAVSTWALLTSEKPVPGVSVDMGISYMKAAKVGEKIIIDAKTLKVGNRLAFLTVDVMKKSDGSLIAQGKHTKFIGS